MDIVNGRYKLRLHNPRFDILSRAIAANDYERLEQLLVARFMKPGMTVVDAGANIGLYTLIMSVGVGPAGKVYAFEPDESNYKLLRHNVGANRLDNVATFREGLADRAGDAVLYRAYANSGDSRCYSIAGEHRQARPIKLARLDDVVSGEVQVVKMDTQGSEVKILRGMPRVLAQRRLALFIEYWPYGMQAAGDSVGEYWGLLAGFQAFEIHEARGKLVRIIDPMLLFDHRGDGFANLLFLKGY